MSTSWTHQLRSLYWHTAKLYHPYSNSTVFSSFFKGRFKRCPLRFGHQESQWVMIINSLQIINSESRAKFLIPASFEEHPSVTWGVRWAECEWSEKLPVENMHAYVTPWSSNNGFALKWIPRDGQTICTWSKKRQKCFSVWFILWLCGRLAASAWRFSCVLVLAYLFQCELKSCQKETDK